MSINYVDLAIFIILFLGAAVGFYRGIIRSLLGLFGTIIALVLSLKFHRPVALWLGEKTGLLLKLQEFLGEHIPLPEAFRTLPVTGDNLVGLETVIKKMFLPKFLKGQLWTWLEATARSFDAGTLGELVAYGIALALLSALALILLWFVINGLLAILSRMLTKTVNKHGVLGGLNRLGGAVIGIIINALFLMIISGTLAFLLDLGGIYRWEWVNSLVEMMNTSLFIPLLRIGFELFWSSVVRLI